MSHEQAATRLNIETVKSAHSFPQSGILRLLRQHDSLYSGLDKSEKLRSDQGGLCYTCSMDRQSVYIETSIVSYLASRPSRDVIVLAQQQLTADWWHSRRHHYQLFVSTVVVTESLRGDVGAAKRRAVMLNGIAILEVDDSAMALATALVKQAAVPQNAVEDALHIAVACVNSIEYLLTWNYKHIANATMRTHINLVCIEAGYQPPIICTPAELGDDHVG